VAVHPTNPLVVLAAGPWGLRRTADGGRTWVAIHGIVAPIAALAFDPHTPDVVYAGTELDGTYRSEDGGLYWRRINTGLPRDRLGNIAGAVALVVHPAEPNAVVAGTSRKGGIYRSLDKGNTWDFINQGLPPESTIISLALAPVAPTRLYALTSVGLFQSADAGTSWQKVEGTVPAGVHTLLVQPDSRDVLVALAPNGLYRSTNGGQSWVKLDTPDSATTLLTSFFVTTQEGLALVLASTGGAYWQSINPTVPDSPPVGVINGRYFEITGHTVQGPFFEYFQRHGGVERFGYPRTNALNEDGKVVQYFQRARLELVLEGDQTAVRQTPLGVQFGGQTGVAQATSIPVDPVFVSFYNRNNGPEAFGAPLTPGRDEKVPDGSTLRVQYFLYARLELHLGNTETPVQLGLIGDELLVQKGWLR